MNKFTENKIRFTNEMNEKMMELFTQIESFEMLQGKDIGKMSNDEVLGAMNSLGSDDADSIRILKEYLKWAKNNTIVDSLLERKITYDTIQRECELVTLGNILNINSLIKTKAEEYRITNPNKEPIVYKVDAVLTTILVMLYRGSDLQGCLDIDWKTFDLRTSNNGEILYKTLDGEEMVLCLQLDDETAFEMFELVRNNIDAIRAYDKNIIRDISVMKCNLERLGIEQAIYSCHNVRFSGLVDALSRVVNLDYATLRTVIEGHNYDYNKHIALKARKAVEKLKASK